MCSCSFNAKTHFETIYKNIISLLIEEKMELLLKKLKRFKNESNNFKVAFKLNNNLTATFFLYLTILYSRVNQFLMENI